MKKLVLILLQVIICSMVGNAQTPHWLWAVGAGGGGSYQYSTGLAIDDSGFLYIGGRFSGTINFGTHTATDAFGGDILYLSKFDTSGNCLWLANHGFSYSNDYPRALSIDHSIPTNIYDCGVAGSATLGMYAIKYTSGGSYEWGVTNGTGSYYGQNPEAHGIAADTAGDVYVTGETGGGPWNFGDSTINYTGTDLQEMFLTKMDKAGNFLWAVGADGLNGADDGYDVGRGVAIDYTAQYIYVVGSYTGTPSFHSTNPALYPDITGPASENGAPYANMFIAKYDTAGDLIWVTYGVNAGIPDVNVPWSTDVGASYSIALDSCDNVYVAGVFDGTATFGSLPAVTSTNGFNSGFLATCNSSGQWQWVQTVGTPGVNDYASSIAVDKDNDIYLGGTIFAGTADFGSGITATVSEEEAYVAKYTNSTGAAQWVLPAAGPGTSSDGGLAVDKNKFVYFTGSYVGSITIGSNVLPSNSFGLFIAKLDTIPARYIVPVVDTTYCAGETTTITYTTVGSFNSGNTFTAELSNDSGSFVGNTVIGSVNSDTSGTITITIPAGVTPGSTYLIRVVSSSPATSSYVNGCGAYYQQNVYLNNFYIKIGTGGSITPSVTPLDTSVCSGATVNLTASGGTTYLWSNGDTSHIITVNPTTDSVFMVTAKGACGSGSVTDTITVTQSTPLVIQPPSSSVAASVCAGQGVALSVPISGSEYVWSPSSTLSSSTGDTVIASPTITTVYSVTGTSSGGCLSTGTDTITIIPAPPLTILPQPPPTFCSGLSAELKVSGGGTNFAWSPSSTLSSSTGDSVNAFPIVSTTYTVTGNDSLGCASSGTEVVNVIASPNKPTFYQHGDTLTSSSQYDNQWYMNGNLLNNDTSQNLIITNTSPDQYWVIVANEANGCSSSSDTLITTGIQQLANISNQLSIYPNPFNSNIFIQINSSAKNVKDWNLQITDVLGLTVYSQSTLNYSNVIDLSNLSSGVYFITVINKTGRAVFPVVRQN